VADPPHVSGQSRRLPAQHLALLVLLRDRRSAFGCLAIPLATGRPRRKKQTTVAVGLLAPFASTRTSMVSDHSSATHCPLYRFFFVFPPPPPPPGVVFPLGGGGLCLVV